MLLTKLLTKHHRPPFPNTIRPSLKDLKKPTLKTFLTFWEMEFSSSKLKILLTYLEGTLFFKSF